MESNLIMVRATTENRIRIKVQQGKSANQIQRELKSEGIGIRRTTVLAYVREFRGRKPKAESYKYTPRKYLSKERRLHIEHVVKGKHIAIYGTVNGLGKRIEVSGTGKQLFSFLHEAVEHPPRKRFSRLNVDRDDLDTIHGRAEHLDLREYWDDKPKIES